MALESSRNRTPNDRVTFTLNAQRDNESNHAADAVLDLRRICRIVVLNEMQSPAFPRDLLGGQRFVVDHHSLSEITPGDNGQLRPQPTSLGPLD